MPTSTWFRLNVAKRARVLEVAMKEFGEHGYSTGSLNTIAREAGIAKGSLFQYFNDKLEFFAFVCDEASRRVREEMEVRMARIDFDQQFDEWLFDVMCDWSEYMEAHPLERGVTAATNFELDNSVRAWCATPPTSTICRSYTRRCSCGRRRGRSARTPTSKSSRRRSSRSCRSSRWPPTTTAWTRSTACAAGRRPSSGR
ncbi:TetR/AcrR family transcriptional regulator [Actinomadura sp. CNU-125]|uniref:TetR/AcrR family transcriptional regulator n=1 Tax=Actinomadura sp. CNU-125 TaxID=1904961 RepID=UPI000AE84C60|nr:TetR/AcrR family transcriptional regulator [Actinomadura sp. CNU-125]